MCKTVVTVSEYLSQCLMFSCIGFALIWALSLGAQTGNRRLKPLGYAVLRLPHP